MRAAKNLLLSMWLMTGALIAQAQTCFPVGVSMTLLGQAMRETVRLSDGSASTVWMLAMDPPLCVIDRRYSNDPQGRIGVSRIQIVGLVPPVGVRIMLTGLVNARNGARYFIVPSELSVAPPNARLGPGQ